MPSSKSASKHLLTSAKRQMQNRIRKSRVKTAEKKFLAAVDGGDQSAAKTALSDCFSVLDKAAKKNVITKNKADRKKSRLAARLAAVGK
ncbi:MAG: 30S ribosomal protein S20 [Lentisphaeria bacterium]|nr:30S ribosomal protein S20 [Lentisphaeria bacterium]